MNWPMDCIAPCGFNTTGEEYLSVLWGHHWLLSQIRAEDVRRLKAEGLGATEIVEQLGIGRASVPLSRRVEIGIAVFQLTAPGSMGWRAAVSRAGAESICT